MSIVINKCMDLINLCAIAVLGDMEEEEEEEEKEEWN